MRTLVHLSDLHFGRTRPAAVEAVLTAVRTLRPDLVAVSGDLTQRARRSQFREARRFLDALSARLVVVPGNHDVPLYDVLSRFTRPLANYRQLITDDLEPYYEDEELAVVGVNTARSLTFKGGRINARQIARTRDRLCRLDDSVTKIIVTHHPFDLPTGHDERDLVGRAPLAMEMLARCGADVLLAGHLHISHLGHTATRYKIGGHSALVVQAGTATSTRERGEPNSFNVLRIAHPDIAVDRHVWSADGGFLAAAREEFRHTPDGWVRTSPREPVAADDAASEAGAGRPVGPGGL